MLLRALFVLSEPLETQVIDLRALLYDIYDDFRNVFPRLFRQYSHACHMQLVYLSALLHELFPDLCVEWENSLREAAECELLKAANSLLRNQYGSQTVH